MWPNPQFPSDLVTFIEEILNGKVFFCAVTVVAKRLDDYKNPGYTSTRIMLESWKLGQ